MSAPSVKPSSPRRKVAGRFHHGDLAAQAILEAERLVAETGHTGFSLRAVATALGVTEPALYRHYAGREALLAELVLRGYERFAVAATEALRGTTDPFDALQRFGGAYVRFARDNRGWFRLAFSRESTESAATQALMAQRASQMLDIRQALLDHLTRVLPAGDDRAADLYRLVWGTAHGLAFLVVERVFQLVQTDDERVAAADEALRLLVESLRARRGDAPA